MKRLHIHIGVDDLQASVDFYSALFGAKPDKLKDDYAKWMVSDPHVNFAISTKAAQVGLDHLGIQVDTADELEAIRGAMSAANISTHSDGETTCCYARSEKSWVTDPNSIAWEAYHTMEDAEVYSEGIIVADDTCCVPQKVAQSPAAQPLTEADTTQKCCG